MNGGYSPVNPLPIDFLPQAFTPGGQVVIAAGAFDDLLRTTPFLLFPSYVFLKSFTAVCTVAGAAGNFRLTINTLVNDIIIPVPASVVGARIFQEFAVPVKAQSNIRCTLTAGVGTWAFSANGFTSG